GETADVVGGRGSDDARRSSDHDDVARQRRPRRDEGALAEEDAISEPGAGHEDRGVPDLAQVAHGRADHLAAMTERRATADDRRDLRGADDDGVLDHGRSGPDFDAPSEERMTAPWASSDPSPRCAVPSTTAECAICT